MHREGQEKQDDPVLLAVSLLSSWAAAFAENSPAAMALLYREDAMLYGSKAERFVGNEGVMRYFSSLAPRRRRDVVFEEVAASFAGPGVLVLAATAGFIVDQLPAVMMRFTQTWVRAGDTWLVLSHHASPRQAIPPAVQS